MDIELISLNEIKQLVTVLLQFGSDLAEIFEGIDLSELVKAVKEFEEAMSQNEFCS